tara:strand:+ start:2779 stop:3144 length:366 start_codon:yes stop_codon:yes gene_type:complete
MKEQLITFETAKLAKEKGFDIDIPMRYYKVGKETLLSHIAFLGKDTDVGQASTQSLLQKWLEREHSIFINITTNTSVNEILETDFTLVSWKFPPMKLEYYLDKYEGIENALQEALKLINNE